MTEQEQEDLGILGVGLQNHMTPETKMLDGEEPLIRAFLPRPPDIVTLLSHDNV